MTHHVLHALVLALGVAACAEKTSPAAEPAHTVAAATGTPAPPSSGGAAPSALHPLRYYLASAVRAKVWEMKVDASGKMGMMQTQTLNESEVKEKLSHYDLDQLPNGPLVRCPSDASTRFEDKDGHEVGSISTCGGVPRFDAPDGTRGGIRAK